jgi:hypothetical protein
MPINPLMDPRRHPGVFQIDPRRASQQPKAREALGLDPLLAKLSRLPGESITGRLVAYVNEGTTARPLVVTQGSSSLAKSVEKVRGAKLETAGGVPMYASPAAKEWVVALVEPNSLIEGPRQTVRAVLEHAAKDGKSLWDVPAEDSSRRLLGVPGAGAAPVSLVYLAPGDGMDLYAILEDLDRILVRDEHRARRLQVTDPMLGMTHGLRLDLLEAQQARYDVAAGDAEPMRGIASVCCWPARTWRRWRPMQRSGRQHDRRGRRRLGRGARNPRVASRRRSGTRPRAGGRWCRAATLTPGEAAPLPLQSETWRSPTQAWGWISVTRRVWTRRFPNAFAASSARKFSRSQPRFALASRVARPSAT